MIDVYALPIPHFALQDEPRERSFNLALDSALQRPRTVGRIEPGSNQMGARRIAQFYRNVPLRQTRTQARELNFDNLLQMLLR
jgi:hypothetical protein